MLLLLLLLLKAFNRFLNLQFLESTVFQSEGQGHMVVVWYPRSRTKEMSEKKKKMKTVNTCWVKTLRATGILVSITNQMFKISFPLSGIWDHSSVLWRKQNSASENISRVYWIAGACLEIWIDKYFLKIIFYIAIVGHCRWTTDVESCSCDFWFLIFEVWS